MQIVLGVLSGATGLYMLLVLIRVALSWFSGAQLGRPGQFLTSATDPYLNWFRRFSFLRLGAFDLSPIAALGVLSVVNQIFTSLGRYGTVSIGVILALAASIVWSAVSFIMTLALIVLALRLIAYLTNRNTFSSFWRIVDRLSQPILNKIARIIFRGQPARYGTALLTSTGGLLVLRILTGILANWGIGLLARLPF